jgi:hypothetical protein
MTTLLHRAGAQDIGFPISFNLAMNRRLSDTRPTLPE